MDKYISIDSAINAIRVHKESVAPHNDIYQLAHDHIIELLSRQEALELEELRILGYRVKDLAVIAERIRKDNIDPRVLEADNEAFLEGYKLAHDEFNQSIEQSINKIIGGADISS